MYTSARPAMVPAPDFRISIMTLRTAAASSLSHAAPLNMLEARAGMGGGMTGSCICGQSVCVCVHDMARFRVDGRESWK